MPRIRPTTRHHLHARLGDVTMAWSPEEGEGTLAGYAVKHGVRHLLVTGRKDDAETRMLDLYFMAGFADSWETVVEPLTAWRVVGIERAYEGYQRVVAALPGPPQGTEELGASASRTALFSRASGSLRPLFPWDGGRLRCWTLPWGPIRWRRLLAQVTSRQLIVRSVSMQKLRPSCCGFLPGTGNGLMRTIPSCSVC